MPPHDIITETRQGREVFGLKLSNAPVRCWIDRADYEAVIREVGTAPWWIGWNDRGRPYVRVKDKRTRRPVHIARLIVGSPERSFVRYANGNTFDLTSRNLEVTGGGGGVPKRKGRGHVSRVRVSRRVVTIHA
jgi:hypothetical protein